MKIHKQPSVWLSIAAGASAWGWSAVLSYSAEKPQDIFNLARIAAGHLESKAIHQIRALYRPGSTDVTIQEAWVSLETGSSKKLVTHVLTNEQNPLASGFPTFAGSAPSKGLWITEFGILNYFGSGGKGWVPALLGSENIAYLLSPLAPDWVLADESNQSDETSCCGGEARKAIVFAPINADRDKDSVVWDHPPMRREFHLAKGLVQSSEQRFNDVVVERVTNEYLPTLDLAPPPELQKALAAMPVVTTRDNIVKAPANLGDRQKFSLGLRFIKIPDHKGLMITQVFDGSPAHRAGLKPYDWITTVGDTLVEDLRRDPILEISELQKVRLSIQHTGGVDRVVELEKVPTESYASPR